MIEGLHADIVGTELRELIEAEVARLDERVVNHRKEAEAARTPERVAAIKAQDEMGMSRQQAPWEYHEDRAKMHAARAAKFRFLAAHVSPTETYRLSDTDLRTIGVIGD